MTIEKIYSNMIENLVDADQRELMPDRMGRIERIKAILIKDQESDKPPALMDDSFADV